MKFKQGDKVILRTGRFYDHDNMSGFVGNLATVRVCHIVHPYLVGVEENKFWWDEDTCELAIDFKGMLPEEEFADA